MVRIFVGVVAGAIAAAAVPVTAATVLVDLGSGATGFPTLTPDALGRTWNNVNAVNDNQVGGHNLVDATNAASGINLFIDNVVGVTNLEGFDGQNTAGTTTPTGDALARNYPSTATRDTVFGATGFFADTGGFVESVRMTLSGLSAAQTYDFYFFASRTGVTDNREAEYRIVGGNTDTSLFLNASNNTGNIVSIAGVTPDANNQIVIHVDPGPNNNNGMGFYYIGIMEIVSVPEPAGVSLAMAGMAGLLRRRRRSRAG
jgi:hypothetical protein